ncbi:MAG: hypothetical protein BMS9Abin12_0166 [Acidimicrobiia bacterium]|nr:MAG: hypothetical protein BMS9Abin12_0166 [Acidimicrobiia bacterium]
MTRFSRIVLVALTAAFLLAMAAPALSASHGDEATDDTTDTTVTAVPISAGDEPAVVLPPAEVDVLEQPWTARFLIPLLVVTAIALVIGVVIAYDRSIRQRYKVVS